MLSIQSCLCPSSMSQVAVIGAVVLAAAAIAMVAAAVLIAVGATFLGLSALQFAIGAICLAAIGAALVAYDRFCGKEPLAEAEFDPALMASRAELFAAVESVPTMIPLSSAALAPLPETPERESAPALTPLKSSALAPLSEKPKREFELNPLGDHVSPKVGKIISDLIRAHIEGLNDEDFAFFQSYFAHCQVIAYEIPEREKLPLGNKWVMANLDLINIKADIVRKGSPLFGTLIIIVHRNETLWYEDQKTIGEHLFSTPPMHVFLPAETIEKTYSNAEFIYKELGIIGNQLSKIS